MESLTGTVVSGMQKGHEFLSLRGYRVQLKRLLGFEVFAGTLNLRVDEEERNAFLGGVRGFKLNGFTENDHEFGALMAYPVRLESGEKAAVIVPENTTHEAEIVEIVAEKNLRKQFALKDESEFSIVAEEFVYPERR